jgi:hypothetical protein
MKGTRHATRARVADRDLTGTRAHPTGYLRPSLNSLDLCLVGAGHQLPVPSAGEVNAHRATARG